MLGWDSTVSSLLALTTAKRINARRTKRCKWFGTDPEERRTTKVNNQSETKCGEEKSYQDGVVAVAVGQEVVAAGGRWVDDGE